MTAMRLRESSRALAEVVRQRPLRQAEVAFALAWTAEWALTVSLGIAAFRHGGAADVGLVAVLRMVPAALLSPFVNAVADGARRERALAAVSAVRGATIAAAAVVLQAGGPTAAVYLLAMVATVAFTVFRPAHSALLPALCTTTRQLTSANVVRGFVGSAAALVGPALAGVLVAVGNEATVFFAASALSVAAAIMLARIRYESPQAVAAARSSLVRNTVEGLQTVVRHRDLALVFGFGFAQAAVRGALNVFMVVVAFDLLHTDAPGAATLSVALGVGGVVGSVGVAFLVGSRHLGACLGVAAAVWSAPLAVLGAAPSELSGFLLLAVVGLANAVIDVPLFTLPVRLVSNAVLARAFGVFESLIAGAVSLGAIVTPPLIAAIGLRGALVVVGATLPVLAAIGARRLNDLDRRLDVREAEIDRLRRSPMFAPLPVASIEHLASQLRRREVEAGVVVVNQGDPASGFFFIDAGEADVIGDGVVLRRLTPGDSFGEIALLRDVPRTASVVTRSDVVLLELDREAFVAVIAGHSASHAAAIDVTGRYLANFGPTEVP